MAAAAFAVFWVASSPRPLATAEAHTANIENGKKLYNIGGCISCHGASADLKNVSADSPAGGKPLKTPIGIIYAPNLTPDAETGLKYWTEVDFVNAMQKGLAPNGEHLIPAFPYTSYTHMTQGDVLDIKAYLQTFAAVKNEVPPNEVILQPILRRGLGIWKWIGLNETKWQPDAAQTASWNRGSYLVTGPGHCSECHTPRTFTMSSNTALMFQGGPHPEGKGIVPNIRGLIERKRYKDAADLVMAFQNGEELGYDKMASGGMGEVRKHISLLPEDDIKAIAEYITSLQ